MAKGKLDPARTTDVGLYNTAVSFHRSAIHLHQARLYVTHPEMVVRFLYYHCIELYLKAFLRRHDFAPDQLQKIGHRHGKLRDEAKRHDFKFREEDLRVLEMMDMTDTVIRSRYLQTGTVNWPTVISITRTAKSIQATTRDELRAAGRKMRIENW